MTQTARQSCRGRACPCPPTFIESQEANYQGRRAGTSPAPTDTRRRRVFMADSKTTMTARLLVVCMLLFASAPRALPQRANQKAATDKRRIAARVRSEFLHAWAGYKKYAWGHDDLRPLTKTP